MKIVTEKIESVNLDEIINYYYPQLTLFAIKLTGSREDSEEIVQDVFVRFWMKQDTLTINYSVKGFLFKSVFNACLDHLRKKAIIKKRNEQIFFDFKDVVQFHDPILEEELEIEIEKAISELPSQCERIFRLKKQKGFSYKEIADQLNISEKTVEAQVYKATKYLKRKFALFFSIFL